jgi:hypothetical protein
MRTASWWATRAVVVASAVVVAVTLPASIAPSDASAQGSDTIGLQLVQDPTDQYARRVVAPAVQVGTGQPISVELDTGSTGLFVDSQYTTGLPPVKSSGQCTTNCQATYSGGVILTYNVVSAQVTIGTAPGSVSTNGAIDIGSITSAACSPTDSACRCPSTSQCEAALFGPGAGIMGIALGQSEPTTPALVQSPLVQLQPNSFLFNGYTMALNPTPELLPPSSSSNTISVPLIPNGGPAYPDGFPSYLKGLSLCWKVGSVGPVCATSGNQNLTVIDSGNPGPRISMSVSGFTPPFNNQLVSISTSTSQGLSSFTSQPSPPGPAAFDLEPLSTLEEGTGFNTGIGFIVQNEVGYDLQTGQALITPNTGCQDPAGAYNQGFNAGFNSGFNAGFNSGFNSSFHAGFQSGFSDGFGSIGRRAALRFSSLAPSRAHAIATQALPTACDQLFNQGFNTAFNPGFNPGFQKGFAPGFTSGFNSGFNDGYSARHRRRHR